ncbi:hypothetical protein RUM43_010057 [Polyplax serrata]|uniref:Uncharacterized protein n=1 Tax=Polyplax serrata TaxID=468196 RepID=A0AAN8Q490_POLSC
MVSHQEETSEEKVVKGNRVYRADGESQRERRQKAEKRVKDREREREREKDRNYTEGSSELSLARRI